MRTAASLVQAGELNGAEAIYRDILQAFPDYTDALFSLATVCGQRRDFESGRRLLEQLLADHPGHFLALNALGNICKLEHRWNDAKEMYSRALALEPDFAPALNNLGLCLKNEGRPEEALSYLERAVRLQPHDHEMLLNYSLGVLELGRVEEGEALLRRAMAVNPELAEARVALALLLLREGRFVQGWPEYEWRWRTDDRENHVPDASPPWTGEPLAGKSLLVRGEQGLGDQIMFASCVPDIVGEAAQCVIECDPRLVSIFARSFPGSRIYPLSRTGVTGWQRDGIRCDFQVHMGSLPLRLGRDWDRFPRHHGYLVADPGKVQHWRNRLAEIGPGIKVGISWRGGTQQTRSALRSVPLGEWLPLLKVPGAQFVSLQYGGVAGDTEDIATRHGLRIFHWDDAIADYDETAAIVAALDLVISVQTAVVHLAGALGTPAWVLVPAVAEWRYLRTGERMPWYPSVRLYRQDARGAWSRVIEQLAADLEKIRDKSA